VAATRRGRGEDGISFEHAKGTECRDARFHRHCQGRWRGSISMGFDANGKRIRRKVSGRTKTAVQDALAELREELGRAPKSSRTYTVNEAVAEWLDKGLPGRSERTTAVYKLAVGYLLKKIGSRPLRDLSAGEVRAALESLTGQLSTRTLSIARLSLARAIRFAQAHDRVGRNVAEVIETPKGRSGRASKSLTLEQAQKLLKAAEDDRLYAYIVVSLLSGIRTEETRALRWDQVHLDEAPEAVPHVDVWRSVRASGDTKTPKSRRSLQLPAVAVEALKLQQKQQEKDRRIAGQKWQEHCLVFATKVGTPLLNGNVRRAFRRICKQAGIRGEWTPRELRHTFVSLMSETGMAIEEISHLVGHSSTTVTETVYRQELRPVIRSGADAMDKLFPATPKPGPDSDTISDSDAPVVRRKRRRVVG
jgi:integrase